MIFQIIEGGLALIGFLSLLVVCAVGPALMSFEDDQPVTPDPYREGLDASARIAAAGWEAERELFRAAAEEMDQ